MRTSALTKQMLRTCMLFFGFLILTNCTTTEPTGNSEPVPPEMDSDTPYPEDPDLGAAPGEETSSVQEPSTPEEDTPGELTDDPYGTPEAKENNDAAPDMMNPPEGDAVVNDDITSSFEDPQPEYEPAPDDAAATPSMDDNAGGEKVERYVDAILLNVRQSPSFRAPIVRRLIGGAKIKVELHGDYAKIRNGQWVREKYLSTSPTKKVTRKEIQAAWKRSRYKDNWKPKK